MNERYLRNIIHIDPRDQELIKTFKVLIAGCGIGSYIAECLLRLGFENLTIVDGDTVELTNLNRQNYVYADLGANKAEVLLKRLYSINPNAQISTIPQYITVSNLDALKIDHQVAINALDFSTDVPFLFDEKFCELNIPVIHPYNLGWAGFVTVITSESKKITSLENEYEVFELNVGAFIVEALKKDNHSTGWLERFLDEYQKTADTTSPSQLSIGVQLLSGMVSHIIFNIATGRSFKQFPDYYYLTTLD